VIFSDESQIVIGNDNQVYIWRKSDETFRPERICPGVNKKISVIIWGCITYNGVGALTEVDGTINAAKCIEILNSCLWPGTSQMIIIVFKMTMLLFIEIA
jgi:hypothetical protein